MGINVGDRRKFVFLPNNDPRYKQYDGQTVTIVSTIDAPEFYRIQFGNGRQLAATEEELRRQVIASEVTAITVWAVDLLAKLGDEQVGVCPVCGKPLMASEFLATVYLAGGSEDGELVHDSCASKLLEEVEQIDHITVSRSDQTYSDSRTICTRETD
ncbi:MAG: hypothetical protein WC768_00310 [Patescibacteria group bacterium]|jgi:hypothetical protein